MPIELSEEETASLRKYAKQSLVQKLTNKSNLEWLKENEKRIAKEIRILEETREGYKKSHPNDGLILSFID